MKVEEEEVLIRIIFEVSSAVAVSVVVEEVLRGADLEAFPAVGGGGGGVVMVDEEEEQEEEVVNAIISEVLSAVVAEKGPRGADLENFSSAVGSTSGAAMVVEEEEEVLKGITCEVFSAAVVAVVGDIGLRDAANSVAFSAVGIGKGSGGGGGGGGAVMVEGGGGEEELKQQHQNFHPARESPLLSLAIPSLEECNSRLTEAKQSSPKYKGGESRSCRNAWLCSPELLLNTNKRYNNL